ncbi:MULTISPECIES: NAD(P)-dependent oxidoreductase [Glaesserella]|uniref:NAD(P)-dependent oxidoreductase n=1 Tax=Glaesserella australis TaxID=2094024 RepID=A0A328BYU8_9PAST|nr:MULTISPECIES: NAD(P)-dependent oxidoreductase [Glaesserella]AUI66018.1 3-hydroxyisobutyrate dehydrogenase [Glaesserella sp. 15-184]RAL18262.1 NAD(P)-dependent oxidoreductase [Glaesserella australis]
MKTIAFLGLGAMGSRMASRLVQAGFKVKVWNRSPNAAQPLLQQGASWAETPKQAAENADFVIAMVRDNEASAQVWLDQETGALYGMKAGAIAIESSTLTYQWIQQLAVKFAENQTALLEAPVSGTRPHAEMGQLVYLVAGEQEIFEQAKPILVVMGKTAEQVIGQIGSGALAKLATNTLMGVQVAVVAELITLLKHQHSDVPAILNAVSNTSAWSGVVQMAANSMLSENFAPLFPVELLTKDLAYTLQAAKQAESAPVITQTHQLFNQAIAQGYGDLQMSAVVKVLEK